MNPGSNFGAISAVVGGLFLFGIAYNALVAWLENKGYDEGYTAILVAAGSGVTLAGVATLDLLAPGVNAGVLGLAAFTASGTPMIVGSWWRHVQKRKDALAQLRGESDDRPKTVAQQRQRGS